LRRDRERARSLVPAPFFIEVHCHCPLAVCEARDPKGLYRRARAGLLAEFTGISSPYEAPDGPELVVDSATTSVADEVARLVDVLERRGLLTPRG
jgi:adenylylsulfate kinase